MLQSHPTMEAQLGLPANHVIVDRDDYEDAIKRLSTVSVTLSRRNLFALLHKLTMPNSGQTIIKPTPEGRVFVSVITDDEAYRDRAPGPMHPDTEAFIRDMTIASEVICEIHSGISKCCTDKRCTDECRGGDRCHG